MPVVARTRRRTTQRPLRRRVCYPGRKNRPVHDWRQSDVHLQHFTRIHSMSSRRIAVRRSGVHGKGVFAVESIAAGDRLIEYKGERISWKEALRRHPHDPEEPNHTFYFALDSGGVIDGQVKGNSARWIKHSCEPNCETGKIDGRGFIRSLRDI